MKQNLDPKTMAVSIFALSRADTKKEKILPGLKSSVDDLIRNDSNKNPQKKSLLDYLCESQSELSSFRTLGENCYLIIYSIGEPSYFDHVGVCFLEEKPYPGNDGEWVFPNTMHKLGARGYVFPEPDLDIRVHGRRLKDDTTWMSWYGNSALQLFFEKHKRLFLADHYYYSISADFLWHKSPDLDSLINQTAAELVEQHVKPIISEENGNRKLPAIPKIECSPVFNNHVELTYVKGEDLKGLVKTFSLVYGELYSILATKK